MEYDLGVWLERLEAKIDAIGKIVDERLPAKSVEQGRVDDDEE